MLRENEDLAGAMEHFCRLLAGQEFFEAHEVLEEAWHPLRRRKDPRRHPVKGLINAAIALEHLKRGRPKSLRVAGRAFAAYERRCSRPWPLEEGLSTGYDRCREAVARARMKWFPD